MSLLSQYHNNKTIINIIIIIYLLLLLLLLLLLSLSLSLLCYINAIINFMPGSGFEPPTLGTYCDVGAA